LTFLAAQLSFMAVGLRESGQYPRWRCMGGWKRF